MTKTWPPTVQKREATTQSKSNKSFLVKYLHKRNIIQSIKYNRFAYKVYNNTLGYILSTM